MWLIPTKKEVKKSFDKIKESFDRNESMHDKIQRDYETCLKNIKELGTELKELRARVETDSLKIATLEGAYYVLSSKSQMSQVSRSLKQSPSNIETRLINRIRKSKKSLVMAEILKLMPSSSVIDIFQVIVKEKGLCSKASFYRYIESLKSQRLTETETNPRLKESPK